MKYFNMRSNPACLNIINISYNLLFNTNDKYCASLAIKGNIGSKFIYEVKILANMFFLLVVTMTFIVNLTFWQLTGFKKFSHPKVC